MNIYKRNIGEKVHEIATDGHVNEYDFYQACEKEGYKIKPGSIKQIWEAKRYLNGAAIFVKCDRSRPGASAVTHGVVER